MTPERVRELLVYDYQTGMFTWRVTRGEFIAGAVAGSLKREGYWRIGLDGKQYAAHRLAWAYVYGVWPKHGLDHRDRDKTNNRIDNLREATNAQNAQNAAPPPREGGLLGVTIWFMMVGPIGFGITLALVGAAFWVARGYRR